MSNTSKEYRNTTQSNKRNNQNSKDQTITCNRETPL